MIKMTIFPFTQDIISMCRSKELIKNYFITSIISINGEGYGNIDISKFDLGMPCNIYMENDYKKAICENDAIFINDKLFEKLFHNDIDSLYYEVLEYAITKNKKIILTSNFKKILKNYNYPFIVLENNIDFDKLSENYKTKCIYDLSVPIITVMGEGNFTNKFDIQIQLYLYFTNMGYKALLISSENFSPLFGFNSIPDFLFEDNINQVDKIYTFNHYMCELIKNNNPDIVILGVPEPIIAYNKDCLNDFGIIPYTITNAVIPDITIFSSYYGHMDKLFVEKIKAYSLHKLNSTVEYFNISNVYHELERVGTFYKHHYTAIDINTVAETVKKLQNEYNTNCIFNIFDKFSTSKILNSIKEQLLENIEIVV